MRGGMKNVSIARGRMKSLHTRRRERESMQYPGDPGDPGDPGTVGRWGRSCAPGWWRPAEPRGGAAPREDRVQDKVDANLIIDFVLASSC